MISLAKLDTTLVFPHPSKALSDPNGLLAFGGDLSVARLRQAYANGIFPWFGEGEPILWWSPDPRGVLPFEQFNCSKKLAKTVRQRRFRVSLNQDFSAVINACATIPRNTSGTWITKKMLNAYIALHQAGHAHSIEVWQGEALVGGLYGVVSGKLFYGESMFHQRTDASKIALYHLIELLKHEGANLIDCQMQNPHLASLGCIEMPRANFLKVLEHLNQQQFSAECWQARTLSETQ
jgi:leucyl/phenylalanyl-tRNA---protein transferase